MPDIELNDQFKQALHIMEETDKNVFITGRAGTGKSTLLNYFRMHTSKKIAVLAPTGVAALNVKGQTIHSFFHFKPNTTIDMIRRTQAAADGNSVYQKLDAIVIDEISMVRADLLDCVDRFLRLNGPSIDKPFGGLQTIFIGDLYQLPPVLTSKERPGFNDLYETPFFYSARIFSDLDMEFVELEKIYRQHDLEFIEMLNSIRNRTITPAGLEYLNRRYMPDFEPKINDFYIYLTSTNELANRINNTRLKKLRRKLYTMYGEIEGDFADEYLPTAEELQLKVGAQIMMLNNDPDGRWVNGTVGKIAEIVPHDEYNYVIIAELPDDLVEITPYTWEIYRFNVEAGTLKSEVVGTFTQYPLMLAWAVTIHKSQGKTFEKVIIDIGRGTFAHGQMYVALSRCTSYEGIILKQQITRRHILTDYKVMDFLTKYQYKKAEQNLSLKDKTQIICKAIEEKRTLDITYLKPSDEKSRRIILPLEIGEMEYKGKHYPGLIAFCSSRMEKRTFRVDRILEIREIA
jgi:ATP-dependent DNA helicase PIF1